MFSPLLSDKDVARVARANVAEPAPHYRTRLNACSTSRIPGNVHVHVLVPGARRCRAKLHEMTMPQVTESRSNDSVFKGSKLWFIDCSASSNSAAKNLGNNGPFVKSCCNSSSIFSWPVSLS